MSCRCPMWSANRDVTRGFLKTCSKDYSSEDSIVCMTASNLSGLRTPRIYALQRRVTDRLRAAARTLQMATMDQGMPGLGLWCRALMFQRVKLERHYGIWSQKPHQIWFWSLGSTIALYLDPPGARGHKPCQGWNGSPTLPGYGLTSDSDDDDEVEEELEDLGKPRAQSWRVQVSNM